MAIWTYSDAATALSRTAAIADYLGCGQRPEDVTQYWYSALDNTIIVPDDDPDDLNHRLTQLLLENQLTEPEVAQVTTIYDAWTTGVAYAIGNIVTYNDRAYSCRQAHTSQVDWSPAAAFTLWVVHRMNEEELTWVACEPVEIGWTRTYNDTVYECIQSHITQSDWAPPNVPALWVSQAPPTAEWAPGVAYTIGDIVTYDGSEYECRQSHTSQVGWEPPNVLALWLPL